MRGARLASSLLTVGVLVAAGAALPVGCSASTGTETGGGGDGTGAAAGFLPTGGAGGGDCSQPEKCDGVDNNCDGNVDEGCPCVQGDTQPCYGGPPEREGIGACKGGTQTCDLDGQWGFCEGEVLPGEEVCDGADNDCDNETDEGLQEPITCGLGICKTTVKGCENGIAVPCIPGSPNPNGETCDGLDDDCDGDIDEDCSCVDGQVQPCYSGSPETKGVGECKEGSQSCEGGKWAPCQNDVTPVPEKCDKLDNDCDNASDEDDPGGGGSCSTGLFGVCAAGVMHCTAGQLGCKQTLQASAEKCNNLDDDCDNATDENNPEGGAQCNTGLFGVCAVGTKQCQNGQLACPPTSQPSAEKCNNLDDDCDGATDEGNPGGGGGCSTGLFGVCAAGTDTCQGGQIVCKQNTLASAEKCNNLDDDCDNSVDENNPDGGGSCNTGLFGVCAVGTKLCQGGQLVCQQTTQASAEKCNGLDDDCDNSTDENNPQGGGSCNTGLLGVCAAGTWQCQGGKLVCVSIQQSSPETCNNLDDDCDGSTDEGNPGGGASCSTGLFGVCAAGTKTCQGGQLVCVQNQQASSEKCNNLDDDCDNSVDEGNPQGGGSCSTGKLGVCAAGTLTCLGGGLQCQQNVQPSAEKCTDGLDNDCDGLTDTADSDCNCTHALCSTGTALVSGCSGNQCVTNICAQDSYCCNNNWDSLCVMEVRTICASLKCTEAQGSCAHSLCSTGSALVSGCDSGQANCVSAICAADSYCCNNSWDGICVNEVNSVCGKNCTYF